MHGQQNAKKIVVMFVFLMEKEIVLCEEITEVLYKIHVNICVQGRATSTADSCNPLTSVVLFRPWVMVCEGNCGRQNGIKKFPIEYLRYSILVMFNKFSIKISVLTFRRLMSTIVDVRLR
jgi:hypothetical protein